MKPADSVLTRTGGQLFVDSLKVHGVDMAFGVPGESYLSVLDALYDARDDIKFVICRQEGGAANMAEAYGKLTGRPGICFVTRGPGATNASIGLHTAFQDSTPLILFIGQIDNEFTEREAFQEIDYRRMYGQMAKWVAQIDRADRVPEMVSHAFHLAVSGRPGPVVLALPEDMQTATAAVADTARYQRVAAHPGAADMQKLRDMLARAQRPFVLVGGGGWNKKACDDFQAFAEANALPVASTYRCQDLLDNRHPNYVGDVAVGMNPAIEKRIREADLLIAVGPRLGEWTTINFTLIDIPRPRQTFVHVHAGAEELGRIYQGELLINSGMPEFAAAARALAPVKAAWANETKAARAEYDAWQKPVTTPGALNMSEVILHLKKRLPPGSILTNGAGNFSLWVHRFYQYTGFRTQLGPTSGAMGYGVPSGVAAKLVHPDRPVIAFRRRRRLPDDGSGTRDRRAVRRESDIHRGQQRHVRHHPHAPGTTLPRARQRHRIVQSRFRRPRARLRPARRSRREDRGFRGGVRARVGGQDRRTHRVAHRSRFDIAAHDVVRDSRGSAQKQKSVSQKS